MVRPLFLKLVLSAIAVLALVAPAAAQRMEGGGYLSNFTQACNPASSSILSYLETPRVYYRPGEWNAGAPTELSLAYTNAAVHLQRAAAFAPANRWIAATGRQISQNSGFRVWTPRPTIRVLSRVVTFPARASIANAREIYLRLSIRNMWGLRGCNAVLVATVAGARSQADQPLGDSMIEDSVGAGASFLTE